MSLDSTTLRHILRSVLSEENIEGLETFIQTHRKAIEDSEEKTADFGLPATEVFDRFTALIESTMLRHLQDYNVSKEDFYEACKERLEVSEEEEVWTFVTIIQLTTDFELFMDIMRSKGHETWFLGMLRSYADATGESKG